MKIFCGALGAAIMLGTVCSAAAQSYPDRPVRVIVAVPAGGTPDVMAR